MSKVKFTSIDNFDGFEDMLNVELLWTNSSPTSIFNSQTISLPTITKFKNLLIIFRKRTDQDMYFNLFMDVDERATVLANQSTYFLFREVNRNGDGLYFWVAHAVNTTNGNDGTDNAGLIPFKIYGIN